MFALCQFMDSQNVKTTEMSVEKQRRLSDFDRGNSGGEHNYAMSLQNGKFSGREQIEAAENLKHFCKICERRFACGRALGGHMRIHGDSEKSNPSRVHMKIHGDSEKSNPNGGHMRIYGDSEKLNPSGGHMRIHGDSEKLNPSGHMSIHGDCEKSDSSGHMRNHGDVEKSNSREISTEAAINGCSEVPEQEGTDLQMSTNHLAYALRTNRKRSWVLAEQSGALLTGMFEDGRPALMVTSSRACDECGEEFSSWKALLAHMKCSHSGCNPEQILEEEKKQGPVSQIQLRPAAKGKRSKRVKCPDECHSQYNEEEDMANCLVMLAMAGKSSSLEKSREVIQAKTEFTDKIDGIGVIQGKTTFPSDKIDGVSEIQGKTKCSDKIDGVIEGKTKISDKIDGMGVNEGKTKFSDKIDGMGAVIEGKTKFSDKIDGNGKQYKCRTCPRVFSSFQALGGHRASNHHYNCSAPPRIVNESSCSEEEIGTVDEHGEIRPIKEEPYSDLLPEKKKWGREVVTYNGSSVKERLHECSICERKFSSGQALGGHKRCHRTTSATMIHGSQMQERVEQEKKSLKKSVLPRNGGQLIDLNLPAPCHDDQYEPEHSDKAAEPVRSDLVNNFFSEIDFSKYLFPLYSQQWRIQKDGFLSLPQQTRTTHMNVAVGRDDEAESMKREFG